MGYGSIGVMYIKRKVVEYVDKLQLFNDSTKELDQTSAFWPTMNQLAGIEESKVNTNIMGNDVEVVVDEALTRKVAEQHAVIEALQVEVDGLRKQLAETKEKMWNSEALYYKYRAAFKLLVEEISEKKI